MVLKKGQVCMMQKVLITFLLLFCSLSHTTPTTPESTTPELVTQESENRELEDITRACPPQKVCALFVQENATVGNDLTVRNNADIRGILTVKGVDISTVVANAVTNGVNLGTGEDVFAGKVGTD